MIRHLLKLVWKRKRANALLIAEIFFSFLVVFAVVTLAAATWIRWQKPLGFDYHDVWLGRISFPPQAELKDKDEANRRAVVAAMLKEANSMSPVESVAAAGMPPYGNGTWISGISANGHQREVTRDIVTDDFARVMRLQVLRGRWFVPEDDAANMHVMVIDADVAQAVFGTLDVAGQTVQSGPEETYRIVGVIAPYRKDGELSRDHVYMVFDRLSLTHAREGFAPGELVIRVRPGTPADFEETLIKRLHTVAPDYPVRVQHMEELRKFMNKVYLAPAVILAVVAAFLIIMVALGLSGVLWQTVTRRTREIGLRRALGASGKEVHRQILAEVALLSTLALILGVIVVVQLPIIGTFYVLTPASFTIGLFGALATIYAVTLLCGAYPSWLAGRVQPAEALHYE